MSRPLNRTIALVSLLGFLALAPALAQRNRRQPPAELAEPYRTWLLEVDVLISDQEWQTFVELGEDYQRDSLSGRYSLIIYDGCVPEAMPRAHTFFIGAAPPLTAWQSEAESEPVRFPQVIDWSKAHPLLAYVELGDLWIYQSQVLNPPKGATVLVESDAGPLMAIAPQVS